MKKKHWYDHLWLWEILYFSLGFFQYPLCVAGDDRIPAAPDAGHFWREQGFLQQFLRERTALCKAGRETVQQQTDTEISDGQMVPLRVSDLFYDHVCQYALPDLSGGGRGKGAEGSHHPVLDLPSALGLGLHGRNSDSVGGTVQFWTV